MNISGFTNRAGFGVSPNVNDLHNNFLKEIDEKKVSFKESAIEKDLAANPKNNYDKYYDFSYKTGILNTGLQLMSGLILMGLGLLGEKKPGETNIDNVYTGKSKKIYTVASKILGAGYLMGFPSVTAAGIISEQPGTVLSSYLWLAASPLMLKGNLGVRTKAFLDLGYAPTFAGFANEINNSYSEAENKKIRKMDLNYMFNKNTYLKAFSSDQEGKEIRKKLSSFAKFCMQDQVNALKTLGVAFKDTIGQSINFFKGERKKLPDVLSTKPSKESMSLGSILMIAGSMPKLLKGNKLGKSKLKFADILIGAGLLFESLGMMSLANAKEDSRRAALLIGGPMRIIGDFRHENPFMYGLRTFGGSSFEYYYTLMNKEGKTAIKK
ncbi:MAG TPA: hypothetical protein P5556_06730 [Candidatus Gastranaerophilales bacterium]|nr:hypothetical protein [Candidatus Gastranaerophilales bacterium]